MISLTPARKHQADPSLPGYTAPTLIGITGLIGSGKSTLADYIVEHDPDYQVISFADHLKDVVALAYGWPRAMLEGTTPESREWRTQDQHGHLLTPREALQQVGMKFRELDQDFWVKQTMSNRPGRCVIPDVRFPNEFQAIRDAGGVIMRVTRPDPETGGEPAWWRDAVTLSNKRAYLARQLAAGKMNAEQERNYRAVFFAAEKKFAKDYPDVHASEYSAAGQACHYVVYNDAGLSNLFDAAGRLVEGYSEELA